LFLVITTFFVGEYVNRLPTDQSFWKAGVMVSHCISHHAEAKSSVPDWAIKSTSGIGLRSTLV
jgi:hypothetical protein